MQSMTRTSQQVRQGVLEYEDWNIREIARILHISESNVKTRLSRGRKLLKNVLKEEWADDE